MANAILPKFRETILSDSMASVNIKAALIDLADYTYSAAHEFLADIPAGAIVATSGNLANKTFTNGTFDSDNVTIAGVTGDEFEAVVIYIDTGNTATSRIVCFLDADSSAAAIAVTPNGGDINLNVDAAGWFTLGG